MTAWERRARRDADEILDFMIQEYRSNNRMPFSIDVLADRLKRHRERIVAGLAVLVFLDKTAGVVGEQPRSAKFWPVGV